eukprot:TRINITY_DN7746_c0_g1_i3.p1 TRINITY_DN7746_c0_g1~~TRINITY_DN7746_c0_g1_i3.p1  ORF type:complete len:783 (-),score=136.92 TRINITY_DN7746_c0_g1_i3:16-2364(-)
MDDTLGQEPMDLNESLVAIEDSCDDMLAHFADALSVERECVENLPRGQMFTDASFPPEEKSFWKNMERPEGCPETASWKRPLELHETPTIIPSGMSSDVTSGMFDDAWFLGALSAVATCEGLLKYLFVSTTNMEGVGIYSVRIFKHGEWREVVCDSLIPCGSDEKPLLATCKNENELWAPLVEKAYAKLHGSYDVLHQGKIANALVELTGGSVDTFDVQSEKVQSEIQTGVFWDRLMRYKAWCYLMVAVYETHLDEDDCDGGITPNIAYTILDVREEMGHKLIRLRNHWGEREWNGAWADYAEEWEKPNSIGLLEKLDYNFNADGTFWIHFDDFVQNFTMAYVCRLFPAGWEQLTIKSEWTPATSGGQPSHPTWCTNPQYRITTSSRPVYVAVSLIQRDPKLKQCPTYPIGFQILKAKRDAKVRKWIWRQEEVVADSGIHDRLEASGHARLEARSAYIIVPYTAEPEQESQFCLRIFSSRSLDIDAFKPTKVASIGGAWSKNSSGGKRVGGKTTGGYAWCQNPQYFVKVEKRANCRIVVRRTDLSEEEADANTPNVGFTLMKGEGNGAQRRLTVTDIDIVKESTFNSPFYDTGFVALNPDRPYLIVPAMSEPGVEGIFSIHLYSDNDITLQPISDGKSMVLAGEWTSSTAGGCHLHETWVNNAIFLVTVTDDAHMKLRLSRPAASWRKIIATDVVGSGIMIYVLRGKDPSKKHEPIRKKDIILETPFLPMNEGASWNHISLSEEASTRIPFDVDHLGLQVDILSICYKLTQLLPTEKGLLEH